MICKRMGMQRKAIYTTKREDVLINNGKEWNFHGEETQEHLHTLHPYPAKFIPQIPRMAIERWTRKGDLVYDPFVGCGTTLLEASLLGRPSIGSDNNPVAILISRAKSAIYNHTDVAILRDFVSEVTYTLPNTQPHQELIPNNKNFLYWFSKDILNRLSSLKWLILKKPEPVQTMLQAIFSSIIVRVSFQDSDTRYAKIEKSINSSDVDRIFINKLEDVLSRLPGIIVPKRASASVHLADARHVPFVKSNSVSLIVTSPPYLNAYDYHKYHRQRIHWIDGNVEHARDIEIGSHDEFTKPRAKPDQYFIDMNDCFSEWARVLKRKGKCLILIGDAIVNKEPVAVGDRFIELLRKHELYLEKHWIRTLQPTKRSFNVRNSRISHEHVLLFTNKEEPN